MKSFKPRLLPMSLGSLPHLNPDRAWEIVLRQFPELPTWPQLPRRSFLENIYVQFSAGFPGVMLQNDRIFVDRSLDLDAEIERLYIDYLADNVDAFSISSDYAAGLWKTEDALEGWSPLALKGQITGPISWGLMVVDQDRRPVLYDEVLADLVARHLRMKAAWQERFLRRFVDQTIIIVDEPYMSAFGSSLIDIDRPLVMELLEETLAGISGLSGIHCDGNADWDLLFSVSVDIISLDMYQYGKDILLYPEKLERFLEHGGMIAWGLVPTSDESMAETPENLLGRFGEMLAGLEDKGLDRRQLLESSFITPGCGTGGLLPAEAERVLALTREVSLLARDRYLGVSPERDTLEPFVPTD